MRLYRCPWCGKPSFTTKRRIGMSAPYSHRTTPHSHRRIYSERINHPECDMCGRQVGFDKSLTLELCVLGYYLLSIGGLLLSFFVVKNPLGIALWMLLMILGLVAYVLITIFVLPPISRRKSNFIASYYPDLQFEVEFSQKISLRIESIYAIRVKNVAAEDINIHFDFVNEYKRDGAAVYIRLGDFGHEMGLLYPDNYESKYFNVGTEFDVIDVNGDKISTGVITRLIEKAQS